MTRVVFEKVSMKARKVWTEHGKRRQQTKEFMQTISPFNKNLDGTQKTREQIIDELNVERKAWLTAGPPTKPRHLPLYSGVYNNVAELRRRGKL
jgi:hypothetical protein